ncbi:iron-containing alcohol dehydrogenase [Echinicola soli]|uniref:Iron-containing alcohol dehydrogenase n=1 Tax=Echinicola soli TaxID=2591634 RepID=A0A514CF96_9BACT|nr:iron-containing alcohol dehydrogenase [Echinicola soli]QDH78501.1 iron-containing alcohol dehydrogenase [Echinicola soli]
MLNFEFKNPTKVIFGQGQMEKIAVEIPSGAKVLMTYGGGSIKKNGIYDAVMTAMKDFEVIEFGGIPANPEYHQLLEALKVIKEENITFMLAVGGGSVIDATKFLSSAALYDGEEPWDILAKKIRTEKGLPFGTVLTIPATGSESNSGAVISNHQTGEKFSMGGPGLFPQFSLLDPTVIRSLPERQLANGIMDAFSHALEQYMTYPVKAGLQDRFAESIMQTLIEVGPQVMKDPTDYDAAGDFMWCCTMALNGLIQKGVPTDWAIHAMGHELTALYGIDHARTLAIVAGSHYRYNLDRKKAKLAQYAERVWRIMDGTVEEKALAAIEKTEIFIQSLGIDTHLSAYVDKYEHTAKEIADRFTERGWTGLGEHKDLSPADVEKIVEMAY